MPKTSRAAVELLEAALAAGHAVTLSLTAPPHVSRTPPLVSTCRLRFGLTLAEGRLFVALLEHDLVTREELHRVMSPNSDPVSNSRTVDVVVCRIRRKLAVHGIGISNIHSFGYKLGADARDRTREILTEYGEDIAAAPPADQAAPPSD